MLARDAKRPWLSGGARLVIGVVGVALMVATSGTAVAVPPPPPNPSDSELDDSRQEEQQRAGQVGRLTNQLSAAESKLSNLRDDVQRKLELANKARVDAESAQDAADQAKRKANSASKSAKAADKTVDNARDGMNEFAASSYRQGSEVGSLSAYVTSADAKEVLDREQTLHAVGKTRLNALDRMREARVEKSNADASARKALQDAERKKRAAEKAKKDAESAHESAVTARKEQASKTEDLESERDKVQRQLYEAQREVRGLEGQRQRYNDWKEEKRREEERKAREAAMAEASSSGGSSGGTGSSPSASGSGGSSGSTAAPASGSIESVISRAMSQRGLPYAWGGGDQNGPTRGIRDGGVADSFGDYNKVGFDCSGLMIYAFAGVVDLPHYSGYQYNYGRKVPLSQMKRGDMLFWGQSGIHHVALYLGDGQMVEAKQSGTNLMVSPVRYDDIMPYAVRIIE